MVEYDSSLSIIHYLSTIEALCTIEALSMIQVDMVWYDRVCTWLGGE